MITLCFPHGHHHTARWRPRQDSLKPLGPQYSFCCFTLPVLGPGTISLSHGSLVGRTANGRIVSSLLVLTEMVHFLSFTLHPDFLQRWCISQLHEHPTASEKQLCSLNSGGCSPQTTRDPQRRIGLQWRRTLKTKIRAAHLNTGF